MPRNPPERPLETIAPREPLHEGVRVLTTTRQGGVSRAPYQSLNLGSGGGDDPGHVAENRRRLERCLDLPGPVCWLRQVHGRRVVEADPDQVLEADAHWTDRPGLVLALLTADCLPVVLADNDGRVIAAAHAGWRGLAAGVLEATVAALPVSPGRLRAWVGPAIGPKAYEVGPEVRAAFVEADAGTAGGFAPSPREGHFLADLPALADRALRASGLGDVRHSGVCTATDRRFFSHRRDGPCGRMATLAWLAPG